MTAAHREALRKLVADALANHTSLEWPRAAFEPQQALLVYATDALFAYYLGVDGTVYEHDMDKFGHTLDPVRDRAKIREVYAKASELIPALAGITP